MPRMTLFKKIMVVTLLLSLLSLLPLLASSLILMSNLESVNSRLTAEIADTSDIQASESLQMRAQHVAESVADFLREREGDLFFLSRTPMDNQSLFNFYTTRRGEIWKRSGQNEEIRELIPLYRSVAFIDRSGRERLVIRDGLFLTPSELRDVSTPDGTEFKSENYFSRIRKLRRGELYVSHLTGFHVSKQEQLAGAVDPENASGGAIYNGVIRFGSPLFDKAGTFDGMVVISLDHRHLMEFTQHIDPGRNFSTIFPSYKSGNYAFLFDDEGWIITHPKYWDFRGVDSSGKQVQAYTEHSSQADIAAGLIPFNLDQAGFIHHNYPVVAAQIRKHKTGYVDITNVGGAKKIMSFAPIPYDTGDYSKHGIFGGVTIGFQVDQFHDAARKGSRLISALLNYSSPVRIDFRMGDLNLMVNDTILLMRRQCDRQKVQIHLDAGQLPSFCFDPEKIKQALLNITRNALEAMPEGGEIRFATRADAEYGTLTISDNGPGIREEDLPLIFEPFFTRKGAGTGLGLSITQRIVEEHHGKIRVESSTETGTVFTIELPLSC